MPDEKKLGDSDPPVAAAAAAPALPPAAEEPGEEHLFEFTEERRYELYVERRKRYSDAAREAYHRLHQALIGVSAGSIILSITFLKDIVKTPVSIIWLVWGWGFVLVGSLFAFFALVASAEGDRERIIQIDCLARTSKCDEARADRLGRWTSRFNYVSVSLCVIGVLCMIVFAATNVLHMGDATWQENRQDSSTKSSDSFKHHDGADRKTSKTATVYRDSKTGKYVDKTYPGDPIPTPMKRDTKKKK